MNRNKAVWMLALLAIFASLACGGAVAEHGGSDWRGTLRIEYAHQNRPIEEAVIAARDAAAMAGTYCAYTGFEIAIAEDVRLDWSEMMFLESVCDPEGYAVRFYDLQDDPVGIWAFGGNPKLVRVEGLGKVKTVEELAFTGCAFLESLDLNEVEWIGNSAFSGCESLKTVSVAQGARIGDGAFESCAALTDLGGAAVSLESGERGAFSGCTRLSKIRLASGSELPANAFSGCAGLRAVELGDDVTLPARLFSGSPNIRELVIGSGATIEEGALKDRKALESVSLGQDSAIGPGAFSGCANLNSVTLGPGCALGARAFAGCAKLQVVAGKLDGVGESAFLDCDMLTAVELRSTGAAVGASAFSGCASLSEVSGRVSGAASYAFEGCKALKTIALVDGAKVDSYAFQDCLALESVTGTLGPVGRGGFSGCARLRTLTFPTLNTYGIDCFLSCALDFTKSVPTGLQLSNATRQVPYVVFALTGKTVKVSQGEPFDVTAAYTLTTASGTPYSALRTPPYYWLDTAFMGDSDHSPKVTLTGAFDTSKVGSYPLTISIPATWYASEHALSFTLEVIEAAAATDDPSNKPGLTEHDWFVPGEFVATLGFTYPLVYGDADLLTLSSGKKSVCKIADDGTLTPVSTGTCNITAKDASGSARKCSVKVVANRYNKSKPHKGEAGLLTTSTKRLYYAGGKLHMELFIVNRTGKAAKNVRGAKLQLWNEQTGQLLYERNLGTLLKAKLANKKSRVFTANVAQALVNGGKKLDLGRGDIQARLVFAD